MITFNYHGFDRQGRACRGLIEAADAKQARARLLEDGVLVDRIAPTSGGRKPMRAVERIVVYQELSVLLQAGMTLVDAMNLLLQAGDLAAAHALIAAVRDRVRGGDTLADAVTEIWRVPAGESAVIAAGERAAVLPLVLGRLAGFLEEQRNLNERTMTALIYPALVSAMALLLAVGLLGVALPRFGSLLAEARVDLPFVTRAMLAAGRVIMPLSAVLVAGGLAAVWWLRRRMAADDDLAARLHARRLRWPVFGAIHSCLTGLRFVRTLEFLLAGGVSLVEALPLAGDSAGNPWLARQIRKAAGEVRHGAALADALEGIGAWGGLLGGWIRVGESGGMLETVLRGLGDRLQRRWENGVARRMALLEPCLILAVGILVLLVALAVLLPVMRLNQSLL